MLGLLRDVDSLLRGRFTRRDDLAAGKVDVPVRRLFLAALAMGALYGLFMGLFALLRGGTAPHELDGVKQFFATLGKVPLLFLLTLLVTFPSLYVCSALSNSRLQSLPTLKLLLAAIGIDLALLSSFGPVTGFFTASTESYPFMVLLNVAIFTIGGVVGLIALNKALGAVFGNESPASRAIDMSEPAGAGGADDPGSDEALVSEGAVARAARRIAGAETGSARRIFRIWIAIYAVVGAQMGWVLRPFIGDPRLPFALFRPRTSNFFEAILRALHEIGR